MKSRRNKQRNWRGSSILAVRGENRSTFKCHFASRTIEQDLVNQQLWFPMTGMGPVSILNEEKTPAEPDVLLFSSLNPSVLVAGTYHLDDNGRRSGSLLVYTVDPLSFTWYGFSTLVADLDSHLIQTVTCASAVLDACWWSSFRILLTF